MPGWTHQSTGLRSRSDEFTSVMVRVTEPSQALSVAKQMVEEGIQLIELCGGFGPVWTAAVEEAIDGAVPVGSVGYGPEAISGMHRLFPTDVGVSPLRPARSSCE